MLRVLAVLPVVALLLTSLGPVLDHHFAERLPGHGHIYLDGAPVEHTHPYETAHHHDHSHHHPTDSAAGGDARKDIIFLPLDNDGIPSLGSSFAAVLPVDEMSLFTPALVLALPAGERAAFSHLSPPEPPPPVAAL